jgi:hypothetical protein
LYFKIASNISSDSFNKSFYIRDKEDKDGEREIRGRRKIEDENSV